MEFDAFAYHAPVDFALMSEHNETVFMPWEGRLISYYRAEDDLGTVSRPPHELPASPIFFQESPVQSPLFCDEVIDYGSIPDTPTPVPVAPATPVARVLFQSMDDIKFFKNEDPKKAARERQRKRFEKELAFNNPGGKNSFIMH